MDRKMVIKGVHKVVLAVSLLLVAMSVQAEKLTGPASDFTLKNLDGENIKLSELRGEVVMINFWASWCGPCRQEMPILDAMYEEYQDLGFTILGVNVEEDPNAARKLLKSIPVTFPILLDGKNAVSQDYNVIAMPSTFMVDRDGNLRYQHLGYLPGYEKEYERQVRELLAE